MASEFVYILTNNCMPDWIKVGKAKNISKRLIGLNCTAVPLPFECYAYMEVPAEYVFKVEHGLHELLGFTFHKEKEFFKTSPEKIYKYFESVASFNDSFKLVSHPDLDSKAEKSKAQKTTFSMLQLPVGSRLTFVRNNDIECFVADQTNKVKYGDEVLAISALACKLCNYSVNGYSYFTFEDETLWDRRLRLTAKSKS